MKLTVVGTGYVGLVTGTCMAETGVEVLCVDNNVDKVNTMSEGKLPIYEPHLDQLFQRNILLFYFKRILTLAAIFERLII